MPERNCCSRSFSIPASIDARASRCTAAVEAIAHEPDNVQGPRVLLHADHAQPPMALAVAAKRAASRRRPEVTAAVFLTFMPMHTAPT
ncbi:hypothetical protein MRX96_032908 [Rhipicephalus microplus]